MLKLRSYITNILMLVVMASGMTACSSHDLDSINSDKNIFIIYSIGYNNLSSYLSNDIREVVKNFRPQLTNDILIIYSHPTRSYDDYITPNSPTLTQIRRNEKGRMQTDTLAIYPDNTNSASAQTLHDVLNLVKETHPGANYGILFSSHSTGWVPDGYCNDPGKYDKAADNSFDWALRRKAATVPGPTWGVQLPGGGPVLKSFGTQFYKSGGSTLMHEIDITDMAQAFPMKMDYIIFDSCFMGGIEVAYEFRNVCRYMIFSQTEILADGMDYGRLTSHVFLRNRTAMRQICQDYYNQYAKKTGVDRSATISLVDCSKLEDLACICREIFESQREEIAANEDSRTIQQYFRPSNRDYHRWFYDLESIVRYSGTEADLLLPFYEALDRCVLFKMATEKFLLELDIKEHCGLSMYLPFAEYDYLNSFYKTLEWNKATGLVQ